MRRLTPEFIEQVRMACDLVEVIGEDTFLKRAGRHYKGLCPFPAHREKTPSFCVTPDTQLYHCFGCKESGNIYTYLQARRGFSFVEAVEELARRAGIPLPALSAAKENKSYLKRKTLLALNQAACAFYEQSMKGLSSLSPVKKYLKTRGLADETLNQFRIGYAPDRWDGLMLFLKNKGLSLDLSRELGLLSQKQGRMYDRLRNRIIFPIFAGNGRDVLGFGARALKEDEPKYINSSDSDLFHKGSLFYGWQASAGFIRVENQALVVEGYMDYLALYQKGIKNTAAVLGTALTKEHARRLSRFAEKVVLCFDSDEAGEEAANRSLEVLLSVGLAPQVMNLPKGFDPDSFIQKHGADGWRKQVQSAPDLFLKHITKALEAGSPDLSFLKKMAGFLASARGSDLEEIYKKRVVDAFGSDAKWAGGVLNKMIQSVIEKRRRGEGAASRAPVGHPSKPGLKQTGGLKVQDLREPKFCVQEADSAELSLLILAMEDHKNYLKIKACSVMDKAAHFGVQGLFQKLVFYGSQKLTPWSAVKDMVSACAAKPSQLRKERYPFLERLSDQDIEIYIKDCVQKIEKKQKRFVLRKIAAQVRLDKDNSQEHLKQMIKITKQTRGFKRGRGIGYDK